MSAERHKLTTNTSNLVSQMRNKMKTYPTLDHPRKVLVSDRRGCSLIKVVMLNSIDGHARYLTRERELVVIIQVFDVDTTHTYYESP